MCMGGLGQSDNPDNNNQDKDKAKNSFKESLANLMTPGDGFRIKGVYLRLTTKKAHTGMLSLTPALKIVLRCRMVKVIFSQSTPT